MMGDTLGDLVGPNAGGWNFFLATFGKDGTRRSLEQFGTAGEDIARGIAVDRDGALYVVGATSGDLESGTVPVGASDAFIRKHGPDGSVLWTRVEGTSETDGYRGVAVTPDGAPAVVCYADGKPWGPHAGG